MIEVYESEFPTNGKTEVGGLRLGSWNVLRWSATGRRRGPLVFSANVDLGHVQWETTYPDALAARRSSLVIQDGFDSHWTHSIHD